MTNLRFSTTSVTHPGLVRSANEDAFVAREDAGIWVVADGMGGHANGRWASDAVIGAVSAMTPTRDFDADVANLTGAIQSANSTIFTASQQLGARMGSTAVALYLIGDRFVCIWAGDSRIYLLRGAQLFRLTRDHTQVEDLVERGFLTVQEAAHHPMSHVLSRAVGVEEVLNLDAVSDTAQPRDIFLLCSDGLTGVVSENEICERLAGFAPAAACSRLLDLVLARGAPDNVTLIAVACEQTTSLTFASAPTF